MESSCSGKALAPLLSLTPRQYQVARAVHGWVSIPPPPAVVKVTPMGATTAVEGWRGSMKGIRGARLPVRDPGAHQPVAGSGALVSPSGAGGAGGAVAGSAAQTMRARAR